ncbi:hypothetical protein CAPI_08290 [Corynebacterium capitovis DSM 44611]|uniref:hypothetical protein n=1 Tax=Corynebacterium capitovis TaxID=131081 RepID=UPI00037D3FC4|nr:hypothetical protein [Corynebacterium capitovis]WKD58185.1 hypothetical protein CAPI_08290 [Corynebacterium capitovis DSM 44611]
MDTLAALVQTVNASSVVNTASSGFMNISEVLGMLGNTPHDQTIFGFADPFLNIAKGVSKLLGLLK